MKKIFTFLIFSLFIFGNSYANNRLYGFNKWLFENGYNEYVKMKSNRDRQKQELDEMRNDIDEIKSLLMEFINGSRSNQT